ncbi:hypothetical protein ACS0TY_033331 [Phlomoides rotata]
MRILYWAINLAIVLFLLSREVSVSPSRDVVIVMDSSFAKLSLLEEEEDELVLEPDTDPNVEHVVELGMVGRILTV